MTRLIVAALLVLTPPGAAQDLLPDQTLEIELRTSDSALEGHGPSRRLQYGVTFDGTLYIWAASLDFDPVLRVSAPEGELLADDDDSGGGTTACVVLEVSRDELPTITVAAAVPDSAGKFLLHVSEAPETESTRAAAAWALEELAEVRRLRVSRSLDEARERLAAALDELLRVEAWQGSALVAEACWRFGPEAEALAALQPARAACTVCRDHRERTLPDEHPDLQRARNKLAKTTYLLGDLAGARVLFEKLLEICSRTLPDDHPNLQAARTNVAATLVSLGDPAGGRVLFEKVLEVKSRTLPDDHPDLQDLRENLALAIRALGDLHGAKALQEKAFEVLSRTLPDEHPRLQDTRLNLAATLYELDEFAGARALVEKVLDVFLARCPTTTPTCKRRGRASPARSTCLATLLVRGP
jgi:tetratricopeptide (TPR) repeat protein